MANTPSEEYMKGYNDAWAEAEKEMVRVEMDSFNEGYEEGYQAGMRENDW